MRSSAGSVAVLLVLALAACSDDGGPKFGPPSSVSATGSGQTGAAGRALSQPLQVGVRDARGTVLAGVAVTFAVTAGGGSVSAVNVQTAADGVASTTWTLGRTAGAEQRVVATVPKPDGTSLTTSFTATARAGDAATLTRVSGDGQQGGTSTPLRDSLVVRVADEFGNSIEGASVNWSAQGGGRVSPETSLTNADGETATSWTLGETLGPATVVASAGALPTQTFTATATVAITGIAPALLTAGATITVTGVNFTPGAAANTLHVAGVPATVQNATATTVTAVLPTVMPCVPSGNVTVALVSGGIRANRQHPAVTTTERAIEVGQLLIGSASDPLTCVQLPASGGRYLIAVTNTSSAPPVASSLRLQALAGAAAAVTATAEARPPDRAFLDRAGTLERRLRHRALLESGIRELERLRQQGGAPRLLRARAAEQQVVPNVGDTVSIKIPRPSATGVLSCSAFDEIRARVVHAGARGILLEDVASPLAGSIDSLYQKMGSDFDASQYGIVQHHFGDPLLLDPELDNNGRVLIVFSNRVNAVGVTGFVSPLDFFPQSACAASNVMEIFYGYVPTVNSQIYDVGTIKAWYWDIRATVVHELKHIAMFATRLANDLPSEETWLEEATAMIAEELWGRHLFAYPANAGYLATVGCEIDGAIDHRPINCDGVPGIMFIHFALLSEWMEAPSTESMLCDAPDVACTGPSIYGTGWLFLRWLIEHSGLSEEVPLRGMHNASVRGTQNIETQFGRSYAELFPEWALAVALDDRPEVTPANTRLSVRSWNLRDIFAGLHQDLPSFPTPFPLMVRQFSYGTSEITVPTIQGGSAAFFELSGTPSGPQVLAFTSATGQPLGTDVRVAIIRLQ